MGKATQKITKTTTKKISIKKKAKTKICSNCGGDGVCQVRSSTKKK